MNKVWFGILILFASLLLLSSMYYPAFGMGEKQNDLDSLSGAAYTFHSINQSGHLLPVATCQVCHPEPQSPGLRQALVSMGVSCTDCHEGISSPDFPQPIRGIKLLTCSSCHADEVRIALTTDIMKRDQEKNVSYLQLPQAGDEIQSKAVIDLSRPYKSLISNRATGLGQFPSLRVGATSTQACEVCHAQPDQEAFWHFGIE